MSKPITYIYKNIGKKQVIEGVGRVLEGETIAIPFEELNHPDLELIETVEGDEQ